MAKKYRNDHLKDFSLEDSGDYNYQGAFYALTGIGKDTDGADRGNSLDSSKGLGEAKKAGALIWLLVIIALAASLLAGMFPATGATDTWYVILPFGLSIAIGFVVIYHVARLSKAFLSKEASGTSNLEVLLDDDSENHSEQYRGNANPIYSKDGVGLVREYIFDKTWPRLSPLTKALMVTSVITVISETLHIVIKGRGDHFGGAILLIALMLVNAICSGLLLHRYNGVKWLKIAKNRH